jgi:hypothetical protein
MSLTPGHEELEEMIPAAALDILEPAELEQVLAHVRNHPECAKLFQEYREAAATLALELPGGRFDPLRAKAVRSRIMARAEARTSNGGGRRTAGRALGPRIGQWLGWAVAAGLSGILFVHHSVHRPLDYGWLAAGVLVVVLVGLALYARGQRRRVAELEKETRQ